MSIGRTIRNLAASVSFLLIGAAGASAQGTNELTIWTMGGDQPGWVKWLDAISENFKKNNPGKSVKVTYYDKASLLTSLRTSLRAGAGPDIYYIETDQVEFPDNGFLKPLEDVVDWSKIEPWAKAAWRSNGHSWGVPYSGYTNEIYYNKALMRELGVTIPENGRVSQKDFLAILKKAKDAGMEPIALGAGDRPFTGAYLSFEPMLRKLGVDDYRKLLDGKLSYADPRVVDVLKFTREIADMGALPKSVATMSLTDSYAYFYNRRSLIFPQGTWYSQRAFAPPDKGGQPADFELGIMTYPEMEGGACPACKTLAISGGYGINADAKNPALAVAFLKEMTQPEMGELWTLSNNSLSGTLFDFSKIQGKNAAYFQNLAKVKKDAVYFTGIPNNFISGACRDTYVQVINVALPAGLISVDDVVKQMNAACYKP